MLAIIIVTLVFAALLLANALVLLPLGAFSLVHVPHWLGLILLVSLAAWFLGE